MRERKMYALGVIASLALDALLGFAQTASPAPNLPNANQLDQQVQELQKAGRYSEAIPLAIQLLDLREKTAGGEHSEITKRINDLGQLYAEMGDYAKAEPLFQRALK